MRCFRKLSHSTLLWTPPVKIHNIYMRFFHNWKSIKQTKTGFTLNLEENWSFHAQVLEPWLIRVALEPLQGFEPQRSWMVNPGESFPGKAENAKTFQCSRVLNSDRKERCSWTDFRKCPNASDLDPLRVELDLRNGNELQTMSCVTDAAAWGFNHSKDTTYQDQERDQHFGLGDKSGPLIAAYASGWGRWMLWAIMKPGIRFTSRSLADGEDASSKKLVGLFYDCGP